MGLRITMCNYNLIITEDKQCIPFLNLTEQAFYDKLWTWTYENDLWDYIDENNPTEEEIDDVICQFIDENMFHKWEDDDIDCFAFVHTDKEIVEYQINDGLIEFVKSKIKEHYDSISN